MGTAQEQQEAASLIRYASFRKRFWPRSAFIEGLFVPDGAIVVAIGPKGVGGPTKSLNESSQGGGDVWTGLESGYQEGGIGVLGKSVYTTLRSLTKDGFKQF
jgi:hypothetical protein